MTVEVLGDRPHVLTRQGAHLVTLMDGVTEQEYRMKGMQLVPSAPERDAQGNVRIYRPLNWREEIELILREERLRDYCRELGLKFIRGGAAAGAWTFTDNTRTYILNGTFDWDTDSFKEALLLSTSNIGASSTTYAGVTNEVANGLGYTTGGQAVTIALSGTTTVTVDSSTDPTWTASGGSIVARFGLLYEVAGNVAGYFLLDSTPANVTATDGNSLQIVHSASGVFTLA